MRQLETHIAHEIVSILMQTHMSHNVTDDDADLRQGMMESSAWRATLTALRAFVATAEGPSQPLVIDF